MGSIKYMGILSTDEKCIVLLSRELKRIWIVSRDLKYIRKRAMD